MLEREVMQVKATLRLIDVYGKDYLKKKIRNTGVGWWYKEDEYVRFYFCFEDEDERPDLPANYKGWTVWATLDVHKESGEVKIVECVLPNGERVEE